jgi:hypothetical protein
MIGATMLLIAMELRISVADPDPDPVGSRPFDTIRIGILTFINDHISTFLVCVKARKTLRISVV